MSVCHSYTCYMIVKQLTLSILSTLFFRSPLVRYTRPSQLIRLFDRSIHFSDMFSLNTFSKARLPSIPKPFMDKLKFTIEEFSFKNWSILNYNWSMSVFHYKAKHNYAKDQTNVCSKHCSFNQLSFYLYLTFDQIYFIITTACGFLFHHFILITARRVVSHHVFFVVLKNT